MATRAKEISDLGNTGYLEVDSNGNVGIGTNSPSSSLHINATDGVILPAGTSGQRQATPTPGTIRFNSTISQFEGYDGSTWVQLGNQFINRNSVQFSAGSYVDLAGGPSMGTGNWTAAMWIKPTQNNLTYQEFFSCPGSNIISNGQYLLGANSTFVDAWSAITRSTFPLTVGEWYHIVWTRSSPTQLNLYINGDLNDFDTGRSASSIQTYANLKLGSDAGGEHSTVYMDEVALWNVALDATAIKAIYNHGKPKDLTSSFANYNSSADLVGYWRFSEGSGTTVSDLSGNGYDGTINGTVNWTTDVPTTKYDQETDIFDDDSCIAHWVLDNYGYDKSINGHAALGYYNGPANVFASSIKRFGSHSFYGETNTFSLPTVTNSYPFSVSAWVYLPNVSNSTANNVVMNTSISGQRVTLCYVDWTNSGNFEWSIMYGGTNHWTFAPSPALQPNTWYHIVWTIVGSNDSSHAIYQNGTALTSTNRGGGHGGSAGWALGGNIDGNENFIGYIDNVRVFNKALTSAEAAFLFSKENMT